MQNAIDKIDLRAYARTVWS